MYLKSIEMQGFKSFADKTKVVFDRGVTAVVGPNGSGKSNITESLRWALGESSAKSLRGGKMPDVIFAGTESRKPLNYASVIVTLDNSKGFIADKEKEIKVERHIYRSGDSEYLIDGKKVRLRDIHDLFMDTGLGRDSFSIISQGRVEAIFNSKPEERRAIFEEAAGVLKYKTRKKETEGKLSQTQDNLDRLEDIIYELENQVKPLEKQALTAKRFLDLDSQRQSLYLNVLVAQISEGDQQLREKQEQLEAVRQDLAAYYEQRSQLEEDNQALKSRRQAVQGQLEKEQALLLDVTKLISDLERKIEVKQLESSQYETSKQEAQSRLQGFSSKRQELETLLAAKSTAIASVEAELAGIADTIQEKEKEVGYYSEDPEKVLDRLREEYVHLLQKEADLSNQLTKIRQDIANQQSQAENHSQELQRLKDEKNEREGELVEIKGKRHQAEERLNHLVQDYRAQTSNVTACEQAYQQASNQQFAILDDLKSKKARQSSLEAILHNHSHFYAGVRSVLQKSQAIGGIIGAVSDHLSFDPRYQTALEVAIGAASQHIIVENEETAKAAIAFLKKERTGRATFLPLTTIKPRQLSSQQMEIVANSQGFLGMANDLVTYQPRLQSIFQNLLGTIALFDSVDNANKAARASRFQVRMVALDGSEIRPGGAFAGGSSRQNNTTFIKPELDLLLTQIEALTGELKAKEEAVARAKEERDQAQEVLETIKVQGEEARLLEQELRIHHEQAEESLKRVTTLYQLQVEQSNPRLMTDLIAMEAEYQQALLQLTEKKIHLNQQIDEVKDNRDLLQERLQNLQESLSTLKVKETQLHGQLGFEQRDSRRMEEELQDLLKEMSVLQAVIDQKSLALDDRNIDVLKEQLEAALHKQTETQQVHIRLKFELDDIDGQFDDVEERLHQARLKNDELIRNQAKLESDCERVGDTLSGLLIGLTEQYRMSFEEAQSKALVVENLKEAEKEVKQLETAIRSLGPINLDAIDQYDEVNQRLTFLTEQRRDVLSARDLLVSTIDEMDSEVKERFKGTFEAIRESFKTTFRQMFGGGSADLYLTSPDILTAGVEISVQPPGKKIQSLNLMSGGEKALSALALLFSIIRVKTIPFVILDEVEAALDEANVKRFGDYLNRFDKESQFIVVTHRKGTMAAADAIYGVTMQESGVSKIVSVKLKDVENLG